MKIDCIVEPEDIIKHLLLPHCSFIRNGASVQSPGNSIVYCSQWFPFVETAKACFPDSDINSIKLGVNFVSIRGENAPDEGLHIHLSMIVGIIVEGQGIIHYEKDGKVITDHVSQGDVVFVPRNAPHTFEGAPEVKYSLVEFGPDIDYQKHHYIS